MAKRLTEAGLSVALLEAGRPQSDKNFSEHRPEFSAPYRNRAPELIRKTRPVQKDCYACNEFNYDWFCNDIEEPYATPKDKPFSWQGRTRLVGGRTNVWGRQSYRFSDLDFKAASYDGYGDGLAARVRRPRSPTTTSSRTTSASPASRRESTSCPTGASIRRWG